MQVLRGGFVDREGKFTLIYLLEVFRNRLYLEGLWNSLRLAVCATGASLLIAVPLAWLADRFVEASVATLFSQRVISMQARGLIPNYEASMAKAYASEFSQRIARTATRMLGLFGGVRGDEANDGKNALV